MPRFRPRRTRFGTIACLLAVLFALCALRPVEAADWKSPLKLIPDRLKPPGMRTKPAWSRIMIWDESLGAKRGLRIALMPLVENEQNVPIDRRMTLQMKTYLLQFCDEVITVLDIDDAMLRDRLDEVLNTGITQWKRRGRIDPTGVASLLPELVIDVVVLFERSLYDQGWRGDQKIFRVGLLGAAFAADTGEMIFLHEAFEESPWSGMQNTVFRVERLAIQSFLDKFHDRLAEIAKRIDAQHEAAMEAARRAQEEQEREKLAELAREEEALHRLALEASAVLLSATEPRDVIQGIRREQERIIQNLETPSTDQPNEELAARRQAATTLQRLLAQQQEYAAEQERLSRLPPPDQPVEAHDQLPATEEPLTGGLLIDFSDVTSPTPTPASERKDAALPGLFDLPPRQARRKPLPPLRSTLPTPTPTPGSPAESLPESLPSATAPAPVSASAAAPFPATSAVVDESGTISLPTPPIVAPPSESILQDIEVLRRRNGDVPDVSAALRIGGSGALR